MPGIRDRNLRSGDLCEGFGLELLRPFALIAPIPRPEDVGADAIATLTRRDGRKLFAEDSFFVQVKTASERSIKFDREALDWLRELKLPYFILSVDLSITTLKLYSIASATSHPNFPDIKVVNMLLDDTSFTLSDDRMEVGLGSPILSWTPIDGANEVFHQTAYEVLKAWVTFETENIALKPIRMTRRIQWETNRRPELIEGFAIMHHSKDIKAVLEQIRPYIQKLNSLAFFPEREENDLLIGLLLISKFMREQGVDPDPYNILSIYAKWKSTNSVINLQQNSKSEDKSI